MVSRACAVCNLSSVSDHARKHEMMTMLSWPTSCLEFGCLSSLGMRVIALSRCAALSSMLQHIGIIARIHNPWVLRRCAGFPSHAHGCTSFLTAAFLCTGRSVQAKLCTELSAVQSAALRKHQHRDLVIRDHWCDCPASWG